MGMYEFLCNLAKALSEYAEMEGSEAGNYWFHLAALVGCYDGMSEMFKVSLVEEMKRCLADIEENYEVIEHPETIDTVTNPGYKELVYKDD